MSSNEWEELDLTPFGRVVERLAGLTLHEVGDLMHRDPEVRAAVDWLIEQRSRHEPGCGC